MTRAIEGTEPKSKVTITAEVDPYGSIRGVIGGGKSECEVSGITYDVQNHISRVGGTDKFVIIRGCEDERTISLEPSDEDKSTYRRAVSQWGEVSNYIRSFSERFQEEEKKGSDPSRLIYRGPLPDGFNIGPDSYGANIALSSSSSLVLMDFGANSYPEVRIPDIALIYHQGQDGNFTVFEVPIQVLQSEGLDVNSLFKKAVDIE